MVVLVADEFERSGIDGLKAAGCEVVHDPSLSGDALAAALRDSEAEVLVVRSTRVDAAMLDAGRRLALVVRAGAGYNTIDVAGAAARGIYVSNCPGRNAAAVAELTFALIAAIDRRVPDNVADLRAGRWNKKLYSQAAGLKGRTLGLLGYGAIGREVAMRAQAFGMPLVIWSRSLAPGAAPDALGLHPSPGVTVAATPGDVAAACDILSVHVALAPETKGLVGAELLARLRPGATVINTARAEVMDYAALEAAVKERGLRAGLDVFPGEPSGGTGAYSHPILALPGVYGTHHIGASTAQAQEDIAAETVRIVATYKRTGRVPNCVNLAERTPATHMLVVRHRDRPGVLAHIFGELRAAAINVQETENIVFAGAEAAVARINLDRKPSGAVLGVIVDHDDILSAHVVAIGH
ncbi:MAG TPA: NAD(P)-dependent oxidoreductase [Vicinamibacterales bacterium]